MIDSANVFVGVAKSVLRLAVWAHADVLYVLASNIWA